MNTIEIFLDIEGYEGLYQVSNFGRVKSLNYKHTKQEKILRPGNNKGYLYVNLYKNGNVKGCLVHRLVADAFIPNPLNLPTVNHIDENKENNRVDNLEWCTYQYNNTYGTRIMKAVANTDYKARTTNTDYKARTTNTDYKARTANTDYKARTANTDYKAKVANTDYKAIAEKQSRKVYQYTLDGNLVKIWSSTRECGRDGFDNGTVSKCCRNCYLREGNNVYKEFIWSYFPI